MASRERSGQRPDLDRILGRLPIIGIVFLVVGLVVFGLLAFNVETNGPLTAADVPVSQSFHRLALSDPWLIRMVTMGTGSMGREFIIAAFVALGLYWLTERRWRELAMLVVGVGGGEVLFESLSRLFHRARPVLPNPIEHLSGPGFPSGHSIDSVLFYGLILYLALPHLASRTTRILAVIAAVMMVLMVGFSRLYVGDHYLTDVLAGYSVGMAWGALIYTAVDVYLRHRRQAPASNKREGVGAWERKRV